MLQLMMLKDVKLSIMRPLHGKWTIEIYHYLKHSKQIVISGFRKALITEDVREVNQLTQLCEIFVVTN